MELDPKAMQKFAWDIFHLSNKLRFMGYDLTTEKARDKGQYTINEIASRGDHKALIANTDEFDDANFRNTLLHIVEVKDAVRILNESMAWWETQIVKASEQEPIKRSE